MPKVLIIEDRREMIVFIANNILKPLGYEVITARDGQAGLNKAIAEDPDLIITDLKLPKLHGLEVLEQLHEKRIYIPAIVMTFHGTEESAMRALRLGARDYLIKPFTIEEMQEALERVFTPQPVSPQSYRQKLEAEARFKTLEEELAETHSRLSQREEQLKQLEKQAANSVDKIDMAKATQRAAAWEEDNARLNKMLAQAKYELSKAEGRAKALEEAVLALRAETNKYKQEAKRLADQLRNLSEAMRLMSQDMEQQTRRLTILTPEEEY